MLSESGNAEIPSSEFIMSAMSSFCRRLHALPVSEFDAAPTTAAIVYGERLRSFRGCTRGFPFAEQLGPVEQEESTVVAVRGGANSRLSGHVTHQSGHIPRGPEVSGALGDGGGGWPGKAWRRRARRAQRATLRRHQLPRDQAGTRSTRVAILSAPRPVPLFTPRRAGAWHWCFGHLHREWRPSSQEQWPGGDAVFAGGALRNAPTAAGACRER